MAVYTNCNNGLILFPPECQQDLGWFAEQDTVVAAWPVMDDLLQLKFRAGYLVDENPRRNSVAAAIGGNAFGSPGPNSPA